MTLRIDPALPKVKLVHGRPKIVVGFRCGDSFIYKGQRYGTVEGQNGTCWMDRNLGASRKATVYNDSLAYGDLFQWGRLDDGHQDRSSATTSTTSSTDVVPPPDDDKFILASDWRDPQNDNLWQGVNGINNPCPCGWRVPTNSEWNAEKAEWVSNDRDGAFASPLKLPVAGYRSRVNGALGTVGSYGHYWSSTVNDTTARRLDFSGSDAGMSNYYRAYGFSVRCIKN